MKLLLFVIFLSGLLVAQTRLCDPGMVKKYAPNILWQKQILDSYHSIPNFTNNRCGFAFTVRTVDTFEAMSRQLAIDIRDGNSLTFEEAILLGLQRPRLCDGGIHFPTFIKPGVVLGCMPDPMPVKESSKKGPLFFSVKLGEITADTGTTFHFLRLKPQ